MLYGKVMQPVFPVLTAVLVSGAAAAAEPVSYSRQIAPILAMHCHACHGANPESKAGGLSTRTAAELRRGGNLGLSLVAGDPARSPLLQYVSGARGEAQRMPLGGPPLEPGQIELIRRWIAEGALEDADTTGKYRLELPAVRFADSPVRIAFRLPSSGYAELELVDSRGRVLYLDGGAVKAERDVASIGMTGEWTGWNLRRGRDWPPLVRVRLVVSYSATEPAHAALTATAELSGKNPECAAGEATIRVVSAANDHVVFAGEGHVSAGVLTRGEWLKGLTRGLYVVHVERKAAPCESAVLVRN
jgi:hypothetical protein